LIVVTNHLETAGIATGKLASILVKAAAIAPI
jgi:hypothetical protein